MREHLRPILLIGLLLVGCSHETSPAPRRLVLLTFPGLGWDRVDQLGALEARRAETTWTGRAIAPSSDLVPAAASLFTGLSPWNHQLLHAGASRLRQDLLTLPEALGALGYRTRGFYSSPWTSPRRNYQQGFDLLAPFDSDRIENLSAEDAGREFVWIQWPTGERRGPPGSPQIEPLEPLLETVLGALLDGPQGAETMLVITAEHGSPSQHPRDEFGALERRTLEVPLWIHLPPASRSRIEADAKRPVALRRLFATFVEAAGGPGVAPAVAPSLFRADDEPILSELYRAGGANHFSLVDGSLQLLRRVSFLPLSDAREAQRRQARLFQVSRPFSQGDAAHRVVRWNPGGDVTVVHDDALQARLLASMEREWNAFLDAERSPSAEAALRTGPSEASPVRRPSAGRPKRGPNR